MLLTKDREKNREANALFQGDRITGIASPPGISALRSGAHEIASIPAINPSNHHLQRRLNQRREGVIDRSNTSEARALANLIKGAYSGDADMAAELAAYREFEFQTDVLPAPWCMSAFQEIDLNIDELPLIRVPMSILTNEFTIRSSSLMGVGYEQLIRTTGDLFTLEIDTITSDTVRYPTIDLQRGIINEWDKVKAKLDFDLMMKMDVLAKTNIDAAKVESGLRSSLSLHPSIVAANIPDTNYLDLSGSDAGVLTIEKLKRILLHIAQFGSAGMADSPISIRNVMISPQNLRDSWDFTDLVSGFDGGTYQPNGAIPTAVRDQIFNTGMFTSAWGMNWAWTPNAQLDKGEMYITTTEPLGWHFTKKQFDKVIDITPLNSAQAALTDTNGMIVRKTTRFFVPDQWRYRIVIVKL